MIALFANTMLLALGQNFQRGELSDWLGGVVVKSMMVDVCVFLSSGTETAEFE